VGDVSQRRLGGIHATKTRACAAVNARQTDNIGSWEGERIQMLAVERAQRLEQIQHDNDLIGRDVCRLGTDTQIALDAQPSGPLALPQAVRP